MCAFIRLAEDGYAHSSLENLLKSRIHLHGNLMNTRIHPCIPGGSLPSCRRSEPQICGKGSDWLKLRAESVR